MIPTNLGDSFDDKAGMTESNLLDQAALVALTESLIKNLESKGIKINPSSRLPSYAKLFSSEINNNAKNSELIDIALLEVLQFVTIERELLKSKPTPKVCEILDSAVNGAITGYEDKAVSRPRSDQFELFLMAYLSACGFEIQIAEPDIVVQTNHGLLGIAAKRLRSAQKLHKNLRDGVNQISSSTLHGVIALDLSFCESFRKPIFIKDIRHQQTIANVLLDGFAHERLEEIVSAAKAEHVLGVLLFFSCTCHSLVPRSRFISRHWIFIQTREGAPNSICTELIRRFQQIGTRTK